MNVWPTGDQGGSRDGRGQNPHAAAGLTKAGIVKLGRELGLDFGLTFSCYDPLADGRPCGQCDACLLRRKGFDEAGIEDR